MYSEYSEHFEQHNTLLSVIKYSKWLLGFIVYEVLLTILTVATMDVVPVMFGYADVSPAERLISVLFIYNVIAAITVMTGICAIGIVTVYMHKDEYNNPHDYI